MVLEPQDPWHCSQVLYLLSQVHPTRQAWRGEKFEPTCIHHEALNPVCVAHDAAAQENVVLVERYKVILTVRQLPVEQEQNLDKSPI